MIVISGPTRDSVERYKNDFSVEHQVECTLFNSRSHMNRCEKSAAEHWERQQREKRDEMEATEYWEKHISIFERMNTQDGYEYLQNQSLRDGVRKQVEMKVFSLQQEMQDKKEAEKWWNENMYMRKQEMYDKIIKEIKKPGRRAEKSNGDVRPAVWETSPITSQGFESSANVFEANIQNDWFE